MKKTVLFTSLLCMLLIAGTAQARQRGDDLERIRIEGRVESIRGQIAYVREDCGDLYRVQLGPAWYWDDNDYYLRSGSYVTIIAWRDYYDGLCYAGEIRGHDFCYDLCDSRGFPRWSDIDYCDNGWRPTRSYFNIHFVIGGSFWHCHRPHYTYYRPWYAGCYDDHSWHRSWHSSDHGREHWRDRDRNDDRDNDRRGGRRDHNGGGGYNYGDNDRRNDSPAGGGHNATVERPRNVEKNPSDYDRGDKNSSVRVEKPRSVEKKRVSIESRSSKSVSKPARKESSSSKRNLTRK